MSLQLLKASTSDALSLNGISKRAFDSDVLIGAESPEDLPDICQYLFIRKWRGRGICIN